jgi:hypothetical protein
MTRRDAAWLVARVAGTAVGQSFFGPWLASAHEHNSAAPPEPDRWTNYKPQFFSPEEFASLDAFSAILIPTDEAPGAREAHVAPFIDFVVFSAAEYAPEMQRKWRGAIRSLNQRGFAQMTDAARVELIAEMSKPASADFGTFQFMKDLIVYAFYTSRAGLVENLEYKGLAYLTEFPGCSHPEHQKV